MMRVFRRQDFSAVQWLAVGLVLAALVANLSFAPAAAAQSSGAHLTVLVPALNVRGGPGLNYPVIDSLSQGTQVEIAGRNSAGTWWEVRLPGGRPGWVSGAAELVQISGTPSAVPEVTAPAAPATLARSGGTMVFQTTSGGPIYVINRDGGGLRQLTIGIDPALSPDGQRVAFTRWQNSGNGSLGSLWVINVDGTGEQAITTDIRQPKSPTWSPDGKQIVVNMQKGGKLDSVHACGGMPPSDAENFEDILDENGKVVGYCYTIPADPWWYLRVINLADASFVDLPSDTHAFTPSWNPANDWQVVYHGRKGLQNMDVKRDANWPLTTEPGDRSPIFSPDGKKLAVTYRQHDHWEIYTMNPDGSERARLTETPYNITAEQLLKGEPVRPWNNVAPTWSPDGSQMVFLTDRTGNWEFWIMNADGSTQRPLFPAGALNGLKLQYNGVDERVLSWR
jgi:hypothetical protein